MALQQLVITIILLAIAVALSTHIVTLLSTQQQQLSLAKPIAAYADRHHVKICIYNPGPGLYATKLAMVIGQISSEQVTVANQGEKITVIFTFTTPIPYQTGTGEGYIIDTQGNSYPITFIVVEDIKKYKC